MTAARQHQRAGRIESLERLTNSRNGNPRFAITLGDTDGIFGTWNTAADASFSYEIGNPGKRVGSWVILTIGGRGTVTAVTEYLR
jgi:hypothetical protein